MNNTKKIDQYLRSAPKAASPEDMLEKLQSNINLTQGKKISSAIRGWFVPDNRSLSIRRVAMAAAIAMVVMLPLSYGATKVVKYVITTFEAVFEYPEDNTVYSVTRSIFSSGDADAQTLQEFYKLYKEGKAEEVKPGVWVATLSNGEKYAYGGNPNDIKGLTDIEKKELTKQLKKQFDEINELRKAGRFEKTYKPEHDFIVDGVKHRFFIASYTLSDGRVVTSGDAEPAE